MLNTIYSYQQVDLLIKIITEAEETKSRKNCILILFQEKNIREMAYRIQQQIRAISLRKQSSSIAGITVFYMQRTEHIKHFYAVLKKRRTIVLIPFPEQLLQSLQQFSLIKQYGKLLQQNDGAVLDPHLFWLRFAPLHLSECQTTHRLMNAFDSKAGQKAFRITCIICAYSSLMQVNKQNLDCTHSKTLHAIWNALPDDIDLIYSTFQNILNRNALTYFLKGWHSPSVLASGLRCHPYLARYQEWSICYIRELIYAVHLLQKKKFRSFQRDGGCSRLSRPILPFWKSPKSRKNKR